MVQLIKKQTNEKRLIKLVCYDGEFYKVFYWSLKTKHMYGKSFNTRTSAEDFYNEVCNRE